MQMRLRGMFFFFSFLFSHMLMVSPPRNASGARARTLGGEVEERGLLPPVGQFDAGVAQLVEEGVRARL